MHISYPVDMTPPFHLTFALHLTLSYPRLCLAVHRITLLPPFFLRIFPLLQLGHACPQHYNPAEFVADLISIDYSSAELEADSRGRVQQLVAAWEGSAAAQAVQQHSHMARTPSGVLALGTVRSGPVAGWVR